MLTLSDSRGDTIRFYVVDIHHHIGVEKNDRGEITIRNLNPREADGSYDRTRSILTGSGPFMKGLSQILRDESKYRYTAPAAGPLATPSPIVSYFLEDDTALQADMSDSFAIDLIAAFPMHDSFRSDKGAEYRSSNERLGRLVNSYPASLRFIGFGRVNPTSGQQAVEELERLVRFDGLSGLKLHPKSESFTIDSPEVKEVVKAATAFGIPVIFHTDWYQHVEDIRSVADKVIIDLCKEGRAEEIANLHLVIGHCGFSFDRHMFEVLAHPCVFGELSGLHGEGPVRFFKMAGRAFDPSRFIDNRLPVLADKCGLSRQQLNILKQLASRDWTRKVLFGTDFPFLNQNGPIETLAALFSRELNLEPEAIQSILGANALSIIPPRWANPRFRSTVMPASCVTARRNPGQPLVRSTVKLVKQLMGAGWTIAGIEPLVEEGQTGRVRTGQQILTLINGERQTLHLLITILAEDGFAAIHPIGAGGFPGLTRRFIHLGDEETYSRYLEALLGDGSWTDDEVPGFDEIVQSTTMG